MSAQICNARPFKVVGQETSLIQLTDVELVLACQNHQQQAFNVLLKRYERYVHGLMYQLAPDWKSSREDLVQEVFIRVWRSIHTLRNPGSFKGWLNQLITNLFYDALRKRSRVSTISLDEPLGEDEDGVGREIADVGHTPDELLQRREIVEKVQEAISALPDKFKNVIILRELHGLPYEEIANLTNTEVGTVKSRIARARAKMQSHLHAWKCA